MLVSRAQLNFICDLVARFERSDNVIQPVADHQSQYIAIIALLRSLGHVFAKVDCTNDERRSWNKSRWLTWKQEPIFREFIEPTRNALLKEFQGGLKLRGGAFGSISVVGDPSMPGGSFQVASFNVHEACDYQGRRVLPNLHLAIAFWDRYLREAEVAFAEKPASLA